MKLFLVLQLTQLTGSIFQSSTLNDWMTSRLPLLRAEVNDDSAFAKKLNWTVAPHEVESVGREPRSFRPTVLYSLPTPAALILKTDHQFNTSV